MTDFDEVLFYRRKTYSGMHCKMKSNGNQQNILYEVKIDMIGFDRWNESVL